MVRLCVRCGKQPRHDETYLCARCSTAVNGATRREIRAAEGSIDRKAALMLLGWAGGWDRAHRFQHPETESELRMAWGDR